MTDEKIDEVLVADSVSAVSVSQNEKEHPSISCKRIQQLCWQVLGRRCSHVQTSRIKNPPPNFGAIDILRIQVKLKKFSTRKPWEDRTERLRHQDSEIQSPMRATWILVLSYRI